MNRAARSRTTYIVLGLLIIVLSLYLVLRRQDRLQYAIPDIDALNAREIDKLEIEQTGSLITIERSGETWKIQPEGYRADPAASTEMLNSITGLQLSDLISVTGNYSRYDLDEQSRIRVTAYTDNRVLRRFDLGKRSPNFNQTFTRIDGDDRVFQAAGNLRAVFAVSEEDLRDRMVLSFDPQTITEIRAQGPGWTLNLLRSREESRDDQNSPGENRGFAWRAENGELWRTETIDELLRTLSDLDAFGFLEQGAAGQVVFSVTLIGTRPYTLEVLARQGNLYPARSSESGYPFVLFYAITEDIMKLLAGDRS